MGSSVPGPGAGQPRLTHGVTGVAEGREAAEGLRPAISVVAEARRVRLVAAAEEANGRPAIAVRRAGVLPHGALAMRGGRRAAAAADPAAVVGDPAVAEEAPVAAAAGEEDVGKTLYGSLMTKD
jgi:hypothetical protein